MYSVASSGTNAIIRDADGAHIPEDADNLDWRAYQEWLAAGNAPSPTPALAPQVPDSISNFQARAQAIADGNFDAVDRAVRGSGNLTAVAAWDYANVFLRTSGFIAALQAMTPYSTPEKVDAFFIAAAKIV